MNAWDELDTPSLLVDADRLERNIEEMARRALEDGLELRPHAKTHKLPEIARMQLDLGAIGITVAKLSEAEAFAAEGIRELFVCYPIVGALKLHRLRQLARELRLMTIVESSEGAGALGDAMAGEPQPLEVLLKIDTGLHRIGVSPDEALELAATVRATSGLRLRGVCAHEGAAYGEPNPDRRAALARVQAEQLVCVAASLRSDGHDVEIVSAGSTPGTSGTIGVKGLTEFRPGNYVFYDAMQAALGVVPLERCALTVLTQVVSHHPPRAFADAGSKALSVDRGAHGLELLHGYGVVRGRPGISITSLSEEHGWLTLADDEVRLGERLEIIPNHACVTVDNFSEAVVVRDGCVVDRWRVAARGCLT